MTRTWRLRLLATLGSLALVGTLACTTAPARVPEIAAQQAETRAHDARLRAEQAALQAETADRVAAREAAQTAVAAQLSDQLAADRAAAEQAAAEQAAAEQAAAEQAAAEQAAAEQAAAEQAAAEQAAKQAAAAQATARPARPAPPPATPAPAPSVPACVNDSTYAGPPFYTSAPDAEGDGSNGRLPASAMTRLTWGHDTAGTPQYLATRAAGALDRLNASYRAAFGTDLDLDLTYRSFDEQVRMREALGSIAAVPGTSSHGTGRAFDLQEWSCYGFGSARYQWLVENGPAFGWVAPGWARQNGSNPEYWHFEYTG